jgi:LIVCS family branched-chain amino acid:cation transporter
LAYKITAILGCFIGIAVGQFDVGFIINIAVPALMFIYPVTIVLILLNALPNNFASNLVFRSVAITVLIFSIPDFIQFFTSENLLVDLQTVIPFSKYSLGWVLPSFLVFCLVNTLELLTKKGI